MPLKLNWPVRERRTSNTETDLFGNLRRDVGVLRKQGELPGRDGESYSRYQCDLCHRSKPLTELRQCVICGRWACSSCWNDEYYICNSCNGIISLHQVCSPVEKRDSPDDSPVSGEESPVE